jgi:hypothetical protein
MSNDSYDVGGYRKILEEGNKMNGKEEGREEGK